MLAELGIALCLFMVATLISPRFEKAKVWTSWLAGVVSLLVVADLSLRVVSGKSASEYLRSSQVEDAREHKGGQSLEAPKPSIVKVDVARADGGLITTNLGYGIAVAKGSSLHREWIAIDYPSMPIRVLGTPGIKTIYKSGEYRGEYRYVADIELEAKEDISALEIRFLTFDVWGEHVRTLQLSEVTDRKAGSRTKLSGAWDVHSENEVERHYASIAYVARVRLGDGTIIDAPIDPVVEEARKFSERFTATSLDPSKNAP